MLVWMQNFNQKMAASPACRWFLLHNGLGGKRLIRTLKVLLAVDPPTGDRPSPLQHSTHDSLDMPLLIGTNMSPSLLLIAATVSILAGAYYLVFYPVYRSPLGKVPAAHWSAPFSQFWILLVRKKGRENRTLLEAHQKYGSVVRVGPKALSVDGHDAIRTVYVGGFEKDRWYDVFDNYGVPCMFSARGSREHSARKRMLANVYSKSYIHSSAAAKAQAESIIYDRLLPLLDESASPALEPNGLDVHSLFLATATDFISAYVFGLKHGTNFIQDKGYRDHWLELYNSRNEHHFWPQELPRLTSWLKNFGVWLYPRWVDSANTELSAWNTKLCENTRVESDRGTRSSDEAVVWNSLAAGIDKEAKLNGESSHLYSTMLRYRDLSTASELFDHVLAGQETTGTTLTYLTWHLSKNNRLQKQLREELLMLDPNMCFLRGQKRGMPDEKQLDSLPLLNSIIMETLRLHAPIPGSQARRTPPHGCTINGFKIPGGIRISGQAYTLHRDDAIYPNPYTWDHMRWLASSATDEELRARHRQFWAFSSGGRMCIGSNFALHEIKLIVCAIYTNFRTTIVDDKNMEQTDGYTARPAGERLILRFDHWNSQPLFDISQRANIRDPSIP